MTETTLAPQPPAKQPSIISPWTDLICIGGGSILVLLPLVLMGNETILKANVSALAWCSTLLNIPHFLASYRLVYGSKENVLRYKAASIYVPAALVIFGLFSVYMCNVTFEYVYFMLGIAGVYLAWHYTGQTWGMMATYAFLDNNPFSKRERTIFRLTLYLLLAWHVTWFSLYGNSWVWARENIGPIYFIMPYVMGFAVVLGLAGFILQYRRVQRWPALRVVIPWVAIFFWYGAMARDVGSRNSNPAHALMWVQLAHAAQYLIFPFRVEMNRSERKENHNMRAVYGHIALYGILLMLGSVILQEWIVPISQTTTSKWFGPRTGDAVPLVLLAFLNIHHYFTDGCIWKISNPTVRAELFSHLPKPAATKPA